MQVKEHGKRYIMLLEDDEDLLTLWSSIKMAAL